MKQYLLFGLIFLISIAFASSESIAEIIIDNPSIKDPIITSNIASGNVCVEQSNDEIRFTNITIPMTMNELLQVRNIDTKSLSKTCYIVEKEFIFVDDTVYSSKIFRIDKSLGVN